MKKFLDKFKINKSPKTKSKTLALDSDRKISYDNWLGVEQEGQLVVDVYQTPEAIVIKSTVAGLKPKDLDISVNNDMITIRGRREREEVVRQVDYFYKECYWGSFSRSIILPVEVTADEAKADLEDGILTITIPKKGRSSIDVKRKN